MCVQFFPMRCHIVYVCDIFQSANLVMTVARMKRVHLGQTHTCALAGLDTRGTTNQIVLVGYFAFMLNLCVKHNCVIIIAS